MFGRQAGFFSSLLSVLPSCDIPPVFFFSSSHWIGAAVIYASGFTILSRAEMVYTLGPSVYTRRILRAGYRKTWGQSDGLAVLLCNVNRHADTDLAAVICKMNSFHL